MQYILNDDLIVDPKRLGQLQTVIDEEYAPLKAELLNEGFENAELSCDYAAVSGRDFSQEYIKVFWWVWEPAEMTDAEAAKRMAELYERLCDAMPERRISGAAIRKDTAAAMITPSRTWKVEPLGAMPR